MPHFSHHTNLDRKPPQGTQMSIHKDELRWHVDTDLGIYIAHDKTGLRMHAYKIWVHNANPRVLIGQNADLEDAVTFAGSIARAIHQAVYNAS